MAVKISELPLDSSLSGAEKIPVLDGVTSKVITPAQIAAYVEENIDIPAPAPELPAGGTTGQVLAKVSNTNYSVEWVTPESGGGSGGSYESSTPITPTLAIPFNKPNSTMTWDAGDITGPFTVNTAGAQDGGGTTLTVVGDGISPEPTFTGIEALPNSDTYDPTSGKANVYLIARINGFYRRSLAFVADAIASSQLVAPVLTLNVDSASAITASWPDINNESSYSLDIATNSGFSTGLVNVTKAAGSNSHQFTGLNPSTQYYVRIKGIGNGTTYTDSAYDSDHATTQAAGLTQLTAPTVSLAIDSATTATASWNNVPDESGYSVQIATDAAFTANVQTATKAADATSHQFTGLTASTLYYTRVKATGNGTTHSDSAYSASDSDTTTALPTLSTPSFTATAISDTQINLTSIVSDAASTTMTIQRATNVGFTTGVTSIYTGAPKTSHNDTGLSGSTQYFYRISTTATGYTGSANGTGSATTQAGIVQLATPTLTMVAASSTAMDMNYSNVANEDDYTIEIAEDAGFTTGLQTATEAANTTTHQFTGLTPGTPYFGRVRANGNGTTFSDSAYGTDTESTAAGGPVYVTWRNKTKMAELADGIARDTAGTGFDASAMTVENFALGESVEFKMALVAGETYLGLDTSSGAFAGITAGANIVVSSPTGGIITKWVNGSGGGSFAGINSFDPSDCTFKLTRTVSGAELYVKNTATSGAYVSVGTLAPTSMAGTMYFGLTVDAANIGVGIEEVSKS